MVSREPVMQAYCRSSHPGNEVLSRVWGCHATTQARPGAGLWCCSVEQGPRLTPDTPLGAERTELEQPAGTAPGASGHPAWALKGIPALGVNVDWVLEPSCPDLNPGPAACPAPTRRLVQLELMAEGWRQAVRPQPNPVSGSDPYIPALLPLAGRGSD